MTAMLHFEGNRDEPQPPAELWARLSDPQFLAQCIPGAESVSQPEPNELKCVLRPSFAFVRGTLDLTLRVAEAVSPNKIQLVTHTRGIGTSTDVTVDLQLTPRESGTRVHWAVQISNLGGLLKAVPQGLVKAAAQKVIADAWAAVEARLQS
jgi:2-furoyl-CoA dehydrogenase large subunit